MNNTWQFDHLSDDELMDAFADAASSPEWGSEFREKLAEAVKERNLIGEA